MSEAETHLIGVRRAINYVRDLQAQGGANARTLFVLFMPLMNRFGYSRIQPAPELAYFIVPHEPTKENPNMRALYHAGSDVLSSAWLGDVK